MTDLHIATIAHESLLWDTYLEFEDDPQQPRSYRARLAFRQAGGSPDMVARTTVIIIEGSYEEAVAKARAFDERQLEALLRSTLPDPD